MQLADSPRAQVRANMNGKFLNQPFGPFVPTAWTVFLLLIAIVKLERLKERRALCGGSVRTHEAEGVGFLPL